MSSFADITLVKDAWTDVSTAVGEAAGIALIISNVSLGDFPCRVETAAVVPATSPIRNGVLLGEGISSTATPAVGEKVWVTSETGDAKINVQLA